MKPKQNLLDRIRENVLIFDGAMGTMIYQRGVFVNVCYDDLSLTQPQLILGIHKEYIEAGADVIETNTFGANRIKLAAYGLAERVGDMNRAAVRLAREAAGDSVYVAASVGPCFSPEQKPTPQQLVDMEGAFDEQLAILAEEGIDLVVLETFSDLAQLQVAARLARKHHLTVLASYVIDPLITDATEAAAGAFARQLQADPNVDIVGLNCGRGPADLLAAVRAVVGATTKPVVVMPNAGGPREVGGRMLYLNSPEYFTEYSKRYVELGVRGVGGCCGTTPAHIRMAARAIRTMSGVKQFIHISSAPVVAPLGKEPVAPVVVVPFAEKSPFAAKLAAGKKVTSIELLPPQSGAGLKGFIEKCRLCEEAGIDAINLPDGPRASARMSVMATAFSMMQSVKIEPIPHYCCRDRNLIAMQSDLLGGCALGLKTFLFITGDPPKLGNYPDATGVFDLDAIGLTQLASNLNRGFDAGGQSIGKPTAMVIGVGANPLSVEMDREILRFYGKIDAGAEYAITQPVFDVDALLRFLERANAHATPIPIIVGIYPLLSFKNAEFMNNHVPGVSVPESILNRMSLRTDKEDAIKEGIEIAREIREKIGNAVAGFQVSAPLGRVNTALSVLGAQ
ncbi:MAG: bifunctional homocysteine S-methyltransferase/methylenetetrahydrofolate reductase [bacterium]